MPNDDSLESNASSTAIGTIDQALANALTAAASIRQYVETAKNAARIATENQTLLASALADVQAKSADVAAIATQAIAAKTQITDDQAVIAAKSAHIQDAKEHADK